MHMNATYVFLLARFIHVVAGVAWAGALVFITVILLPAIRGAGPAGGSVMDQIVRVRRLPPILPNLKKWLKPLKKDKGPICDYVNTTKQLLKVAETAGVTWKHNGLRHSFISYRVAAIADVPRVADEAGNSPQIIRQHYLKRVTPALARKWFAIQPTQMEKSHENK